MSVCIPTRRAFDRWASRQISPGDSLPALAPAQLLVQPFSLLHAKKELAAERHQRVLLSQSFALRVQAPNQDVFCGRVHLQVRPGRDERRSPCICTCQIGADQVYLTQVPEAWHDRGHGYCCKTLCQGPCSDPPHQARQATLRGGMRNATKKTPMELHQRVATAFPA